MAGALREPHKMKLISSIFDLDRIVHEWFAARFRTDDNKMRLQRKHPAPGDLPASYALFDVLAHHDTPSGKFCEGRVGTLRLYSNEAILHVDKKFAYMFDETEAVFRKLQR